MAIEVGVYRIGECEIDPAQGTIVRGADRVFLRQQTLQVLIYLLRNRGRIVSKQELFDNIWPEIAVTDDAVVQCMVDIRKALGDDARTPRYIRTVPRLGYQVIAKVDVSQPPGNAAIPVPTPATDVNLIVDSAISQLTESVPPIAAASVRTNRWGLAVAAASLCVLIGTALWVLARGGIGAVGSDPNPATSAGRRVIAIVPFVNQSADQDLDWLSEGLPDMLITGLARAPQLEVITRSQLGGLSRRTAANRMQIDDAIALARKAGASIVILGQFARIGNAIRMDLHWHGTARGQLLGATHLTVNELPRLLQDVDIVALRVSEALGAPVGVPLRLTDALTDNLEAYRAYSLALDKANAYDTEGALQLLGQATALDPGFAMAYARVGYIYAIVRVNERDRATPYLEKALTLSERLTQKDRLFISAWYEEARQDFNNAIDMWRQVVSHYPTQMEAYRRLALCLTYADRLEESVSVLERALAIDPDAKDLWNAIGFAYSHIGRYARAVAAHERYVALDPMEGNAYDSLGMTYAQAGRWNDALSALDRAQTLRPDFHFVAVHKGDVLYQMGRYRDAIAAYRKAVDIAPSNWDRAMAYNHLAIVHWRRGDLREARVAAGQEILFGNDFGTELRLAIAEGNKSEVQRLRLRYFGDSETAAQGVPASTTRERPYLLGLLALHDGHADKALNHFRESLRIPKVWWGINSVEDGLAEALVATGHSTEAVTEYERIIALNPSEATAVYRLAELHDRLGRTVDARAGYSRFLELWKFADADLPQVIRARTRLAVLN